MVDGRSRGIRAPRVSGVLARVGVEGVGRDEYLVVSTEGGALEGYEGRLRGGEAGAHGVEVL